MNAIDPTLPLSSAPRPKKEAGAQYRKRALHFAALAAGVAVAVTGGYTYWELVGSRYVSTDDAYAEANVASDTSLIPGRVAAVKIQRVVGRQPLGGGEACRGTANGE